MSEQDNIQVIRANFEALNVRDGEHFRALRAADFAAEVPGSSNPLNAEQTWTFNLGYLSAFPDAVMEATRMIAQGDYVVALYKASGTHTQPMRASNGSSIPATGKPFAVNGCSVYELKHGKIFHQWDFADMLSLFSQLGIGSAAPALA
jgi:steroid delta-isomerase-like uncharacterized protein